MTPDFSEKLKRNLDALRLFVEGKVIGSCRLVHYVGVDRPNAIDVPLVEVEAEISGCLAEGFLVGWFLAEDRLYVWVQEPGCPVPASENVIAEKALVDVDALLKNAGFTNGA